MFEDANQRKRLTEHATADVHADPLVPFFGEDFSTEATPGPDIEQVARSSSYAVLLLVLIVVIDHGLFGSGQVEQFEAAVCHLCLDGLDAGVVGVLCCFSCIVKLRTSLSSVSLSLSLRCRSEMISRRRVEKKTHDFWRGDVLRSVPGHGDYLSSLGKYAPAECRAAGETRGGSSGELLPRQPRVSSLVRLSTLAADTVQG